MRHLPPKSDRLLGGWLTSALYVKREHGLALLSPYRPSLILGVEQLLDAFLYPVEVAAPVEGPTVRIRLPPAGSLRTIGSSAAEPILALNTAAIPADGGGVPGLGARISVCQACAVPAFSTTGAAGAAIP